MRTAGTALDVRPKKPESDGIYCCLCDARSKNYCMISIVHFCAGALGEELYEEWKAAEQEEDPMLSATVVTSKAARARPSTGARTERFVRSAPITAAIAQRTGVVQVCC